MISMMNHSPRGFHISASTLRFVGIALLAATTIVAQSRIVRPSGQANSNSGKRSHIATLHSTDSSEGSRVAITSDQSLNDYEAYRRGDLFYVKIPAADVPRAEAVRGRGFADIKSQRSGNSTLLSFRLQPGATAHVEQRGNKLDVVVSVPAGASSVAANRPRDLARPNNANSGRNSNTSKRGSNPAASNKNASARDNSPTNASSNNSNTKAKPVNANSSIGSTTNPTPAPSVGPSPKPSPTPKSPSPSPSQKPSVAAWNSASPSPAGAGTAPARDDFWTRAKARAHYWLLLAQLNPIPVATVALILILIIALLLVQRRRAKSTRRVKTVTKSKTAPTVSVSDPVASKASESELPIAAATAPIVATSDAGATESKEDKYETTPIVPATQTVASPPDDGRRERVSRAAEEAKKVFAGDVYDESIIGSQDRETRRLVGAELLSAMVGRNVDRRNRARDAFMKHGYFDDATRDLRVAGSDNERAAAARRLSFVHDREATPHLIGALGDSSPDVRRAAVEALTDLRDPAAIGPLNSLMQNETDRKVPRPLIKHAIDACATSADEEAPPISELPSSDAVESAPLPAPTPQSFETDREVIEI
jgi:HEAT repeats